MQTHIGVEENPSNTQSPGLENNKMYILGISCYYHDSAAVILKDGIPIAAADEERFSRIKHDSSFPELAIDFCFKSAGITSKDLDFVVFYEKPFLKFERQFFTSLSYTPRSYSFFTESMKKFFFDQLWIKSKILSSVNVSARKLLFSEHHLSHMASAYYASPFKKSALLSIDGVGEWTTVAWGIGSGNKIEIKEELRFPNSLGLLYSAFTQFVGFEVNEGEYKVMGLAPYGKPKYVKEIKQLLDIKSDGSFAIDQSYFSYQYSPSGIYTKKFISLFGKPNTPGKDEVIQQYADIAASVQTVLEDIIISIVNYIHKKTNLDNLCYAGGVALNSSCNWKVFKTTKIKNLFIQPSAGDSGGALGAALWAYHGVLNKKRMYTMTSSYLGASNSQDDVIKFLDENNIPYRALKTEKQLVEFVSTQIKNGKVIGWIQDRFEWGPRALGNRSILADPRKKEMKNLVNKKIKFREGFRPFAPSVLAEKGKEYFEVGSKKNNYPLYFMLFVVPVKKEWQKNLAAITHVDGTARPQFVKKEANPLYHSLIEAFGNKTGTYALLNTSFNLKGEPIVNSVQEAYSTFKRSGIDILVIGKIVITK